METTTIEIPKGLHRRLKIEAAKKGLAVRDAATVAITEWLKRKGGK